jgi:hypothetical protein
MDLKQLREMGGFIPSKPVKRTVTWQPLDDNGQPAGDQLTFDIHVKKLSFGAIERLMDERNVDRARMAAFISDSVSLGEEGKEKLSYQDAYQLDPTLATVFMQAVSVVNGTARQANGADAGVEVIEKN